VSERPVRLGVLGYGHFVRTNFIKHLRLCKSLEIVGVYNRGEERRRQAAEDGFWTTGDLDEMLGRDDVEAIYIGTHNEAHHHEAVAAARAGKHIFCEKPMALTMAEINDMVAEAEKAGVLTHVNHGGPYDPAFEKLQQLVRDRCGRIMQVWVRNSRLFGTWKTGARHFAVEHPEISGGWTYHHYCHFLNIACVLINSMANPATKVYHLLQTSCPEAPSEELCSSLVRFANGATAQICDGTTIGGFDDMGVIGTDGDCRRVGNQLILVTPGPHDPTQRPGSFSQVIERFEIADGGKNITRVGDIFAHAVRSGDGSRLLSFRWIAHEYRILEALSESARTGEAVAVKP
jgi:predicted dehydrogenase